MFVPGYMTGHSLAGSPRARDGAVGQTLGS